MTDIHSGNIHVIMKYLFVSIVFSIWNISESAAGKIMHPKLGILESNLSWQETDSSLSLLNAGEVVWQLNYDKSEDKPYFYPLRTLNGIDLALERPDDHPWHRGLWFSWKYINGVNYWEENPETGLAPGRSLVHEVNVQKNSDYSAMVDITIHYTPDPSQNPLLVEHRTLTISAPDDNGNYRIYWTHQFTANDKKITLDRTPPSEQIWGGYSGISFRASLEDLGSYRYLDSNGWTSTQSLTGYGEKARWMDLTGKVIEEDTSTKFAGLAIFDHPDNLRHPSPWYVWYNRDEKEEPSGYNHAFFTPAFLYNRPYELSAGDSFILQYQTLIHQGLLDMEALDSEYQSYISK